MPFVFLSIWLAAIVGWVANIFQIVNQLNEPFTTLLAFKMIGAVVAPLGSILGLIGLFQ